MEIKIFVKKLINIWDPLGVYGLAPQNEYDDIVNIVANFLESNADEKTIKKYLLNQYYNDKTKSEAKVDELIDLLIFFKQKLCQKEHA